MKGSKVDCCWYILRPLKWSLKPKGYDVKEWVTHVVYWVNQNFKDRNSIDASPYTYQYITNSKYISWWVYFVTGLNLVLQQSSTAALAKTKEGIAKKSSCCYLSRSLKLLCTLRRWCSSENVSFWFLKRGQLLRLLFTLRL